MVSAKFSFLTYYKALIKKNTDIIMKNEIPFRD